MQRLPMFYGAEPHIFEKARELRKSMTQSEKLLWEQLKKRKLKGYRFRQQYPISEFIADFYCHSAKLVIEVDGGIHERKAQKTYDILRTSALNDLGITVIRFRNKEIEHRMEHVLHTISSFLDSL